LGVAVRAQQGAEPPREKDNGRPAVRGKTRPQPKVTVSTPTVDRALSDAPPTVEAQNETTALLLLTLVFVIILVEGLLVAASGFMSEEWDGIVQVRPRGYAGRCCAPIAALTRGRGPQNNVLPLFAPTLGLFLLGSSSYGACAARLAGLARACVLRRAATRAPQACGRHTARPSSACARYVCAVRDASSRRNRRDEAASAALRLCCARAAVAL
jgi:hypothetical protein